jgi:hypothetical protein
VKDAKLQRAYVENMYALNLINPHTPADIFGYRTVFWDVMLGAFV